MWLLSARSEIIKLPLTHSCRVTRIKSVERKLSMLFHRDRQEEHSNWTNDDMRCWKRRGERQKVQSKDDDHVKWNDKWVPLLSSHRRAATCLRDWPDWQTCWSSVCFSDRCWLWAWWLHKSRASSLGGFRMENVDWLLAGHPRTKLMTHCDQWWWFVTCKLIERLRSIGRGESICNRGYCGGLWKWTWKAVRYQLVSCWHCHWQNF